MQDDLPNTPTPFDAPQPAMPGETPLPNPAWASDLRKLYNSVVEEPLPDSFKALLSRLDFDD